MNKGKNPVFLPPASSRVLAIPELLSLIFAFLAHTDVGVPLKFDEADPELSTFGVPRCSCICTQCNSDQSSCAVAGTMPTGQLSFPSPFSIPRVPRRRAGALNHNTKQCEESDGDDDGDDEEVVVCHCPIPVHHQLSNMLSSKTGRRQAPTGPNRPSYNFNNALVCKTWSPIALDVLWRVVDRPEHLFSLLDGAWGSKLTPGMGGLGMSADPLRGLRGLFRDENREGRMPGWWRPGVQSFLGIPFEESDDDDDDSDDEDQGSQSKMVKRWEYEMFSFRAPPTPASWARFDRYARRVRHLVYTRPCLTESAMNHIAVTRPRLAVLPRMHSLTWSDNPLTHAVLFMHAGIKRFEVRIEVFGREKVDPRTAAEQTYNTYNDLGLNAFNYSGGDDGTEDMHVLYSVSGEGLLPNKSLSRTLVTQLAEIPRRMPNLQVLCISSYIPVSLYLPALLCTVFKAPPSPAEDEEEGDASSSQASSSSSATLPPLTKLRSVLLPRYYSCAPILERLSKFPHLDTLEYSFDEAVGWGRPADVGLGKCVPEGWERYEPEIVPVSREGGAGRRTSWFRSLIGRSDAAPVSVDDEDDEMDDDDENTETDANLVEPGERPPEEAREAALNTPVASSSTIANHPSAPEFIDNGHRAPRVKLGMFKRDLVIPATALELNTPRPTTTAEYPSDSTMDTTSMTHHQTRPSPATTPIFRNICDLNLTIAITDARDLLLSSPSQPTQTSSELIALQNAVISDTFHSSLGSAAAPPTWPQNLVHLFIDVPPGIVATPMEIRELIQAIALACYGGGSGGTKPARLERLGLVCCSDPDSAYEAMSGGFGTVKADAGERYLTRRALQPLLEHLPGEDISRNGDVKPKFAFKTFQILHHFPVYLTQEDVEDIARTWGGCIEKLTLGDEPIAAFGMSKAGLCRYGGGELEDDVASGRRRPEATLTLAALLPFAKYCTELKELGLFIDASKGVRGLIDPIFRNPHSAPEGEDVLGKGECVEIDVYTSAIARRYLATQASSDDMVIPNAYPIFRKLERLSMGVSVISVNIADLDYKWAPESPTRDGDGSNRDNGDEDLDVGQAAGLPGGAGIGVPNQPSPRGKATFVNALEVIQEAACIRVDEQRDLSKAKTVHYDNSIVDEEAHFLNYIRMNGLRLGFSQEDDSEAAYEARRETRGGAGGWGAEDDSDTSRLVPLFLAQILPCFPSQSSSSGPTSSAFTTVIVAGTTWSPSPSTMLSSSWALQQNWSVGEPYEVEEAKERRRKRRAERALLEQQQEQQLILQQQHNAPITAPTQGTGTLVASLPTAPIAPSAPVAITTTAMVPAPPNPTGTSSIVIPFIVTAPGFAEPSAYIPQLVSSVFRARIKKWMDMNETLIPMAVAMREGGRIWGGRVSRELGTRRREVDELQVRVQVMEGLARARGEGAGSNEAAGLQDGCVIS